MNDTSQLLLFIGSYAPEGEEGVRIFRFGAAAGGTLEPAASAGGISNPTFLAADPERRLLYAIGDRANGEGGKEGLVATYAYSADGGELTELGRAGTMPAHGREQTTTCHISRDPRGPHLAVTSYHGARIGLMALDENGVAGQLLDTAVHTGRGTHPERQDRPHPHSAIFSPDGRFMLVSDLGLDLIRTYEIDEAAGKLMLRSEAAVHPGAGPRHLAFHPGGQAAYVINEVDSTITSFRYHPQEGRLEEARTVSTLPALYTGDNICAEIAVSPDGRYLYGSNRGHDSIAVFEIGGETLTELAAVGHVPTHGGHPRHFALTPDGGFLIAANRDANLLAVFRIEKSSGIPVFTGHTAAVSRPVCVVPIQL
ncbi:lactonase family protein [Paenibacillus spiritus]|uniref:Lactonase family protein n=1 Tax=Paenibacillus spiritus TaxID=2496557 RepID=A0A5J5G9F3_9BACL|nr:lactonase family protein [Paenibacillus spiritus]KAA9004083.1 lactonase family protein [Paenibacillus spiritus]